MALVEPKFLWSPSLAFSFFSIKRQKTDFSCLWNGNTTHFFFGYGRIALLEGARLLGLSAGKNVLLPAYICQSGVEPFLETGTEVRFYEVNSKLEPEMQSLMRLIDKNSRAIMYVNYFGYPASCFNEIKDVCHRYGLYIIEDNAHGYLSRVGSQLLGTFGDIGISSIWKLLPVPEGAVLFVNNVKLLENKEAITALQARQEKYPEIHRAAFYQYMVYGLLSELEQRYGIPTLKLYRLLRRVPQNNPVDHTAVLGEKWKIRMSKVSMMIARAYDIDKTCRFRDENSRIWINYCSRRNDIHPFLDVLHSACPFYMPIIAEHPEAFASEMAVKGIPAYLWPPALPQTVAGNSSYSMSNYLASHLFTVPNHQSVDPKKLRRALLGN